jgi:hypothetical protein
LFFGHGVVYTIRWEEGDSWAQGEDESGHGHGHGHGHGERQREGEAERARTPYRSSSRDREVLHRSFGAVVGLGRAEYRDEDLEETVDDPSHSATVRVSASSQLSIVLLGAWIALRGHSSAVVESLPEAMIAGLTPLDVWALRAPASTSADWSNTSQTSQGLVVSALQSHSCFCEHHGAVVNPDAW